MDFEKFVEYCSPNIERVKAMEISQLCGSPLTSDLGRYLGVPLIQGRKTSDINKRLNPFLWLAEWLWFSLLLLLSRSIYYAHG